jgi:hypothetical protein
MLKPKYTKLAADGSALPDDSTEKHLAVRVEFPNQPAFIVSAYRCATRELPHAKAIEAASKHDAYGWQWRPMTVDEGYFTADRTRTDRTLDPNFFPDAEEYETSWTSDEYKPSPSDVAWFVNLGYGSVYWDNQSNRSGVRAVCAGQS